MPRQLAAFGEALKGSTAQSAGNFSLGATQAIGSR
jgi:hypothetical protein